MNDEQTDLLFDLLMKKAIYGLDEAEQEKLDSFDQETVERELSSLEITAAAISMVGLSDDEKLPPHLHTKIASYAEHFLATTDVADELWPPSKDRTFENDGMFEQKPSASWFGWLGWGAAVAACLALALNIWFTRVQPVEVATNKPPVEIPAKLTPAQAREELLNSASDIVKADWAPGNVKELKQISGDVVWSDQKQVGFMRLRGLPVNNTSKVTYQLWIFDKTQDKATPIDGGTFDVSSEGEVIIPMDAKLKAEDPAMFAITIEKPGGVVVSKREKIAALAMVETKPNKTA